MRCYTNKCIARTDERARTEPASNLAVKNAKASDGFALLTIDNHRQECAHMLGMDAGCVEGALSQSACQVRGHQLARSVCKRDPSCRGFICPSCSTLDCPRALCTLKYTLRANAHDYQSAECEALILQLLESPHRCDATNASAWRRLGCFDHMHNNGTCFDRKRHTGRGTQRNTHYRQLRACKSSRRNAVISFAWGYDAATLRLFMSSFHLSGIDEHAQGLILTSPDLDPSRLGELRQLAAINGFVTLRPATSTAAVTSPPYELYGFEERMRQLGVSLGCGVLSTPATARYFHIDAVLHTSAYSDCFGKVFLLDSRDSYFQADPFLHVQHGLYVTQEQQRRNSTQRYPYDVFNAAWLRMVDERSRSRFWRNDVSSGVVERIIAKFGEDVVNLNSGAILGTIYAIQRYLYEMMRLLRRVGMGGIVYAGVGIDQGVHNYLVYLEGIPDVNISFMSNEEGPIFHNVCWEHEWGDGKPPSHVAEVHASALHASDPLFKLMNGHRTQVAAVVHQWSHCWYLRKRVVAWVDTNNVASPEALWDEHRVAAENHFKQQRSYYATLKENRALR